MYASPFQSQSEQPRPTSRVTRYRAVTPYFATLFADQLLPRYAVLLFLLLLVVIVLLLLLLLLRLLLLAASVFLLLVPPAPVPVPLPSATCTDTATTNSTTMPCLRASSFCGRCRPVTHSRTCSHAHSYALTLRLPYLPGRHHHHHCPIQRDEPA